MKNILVPIDFSSNAVNALNYAGHLAALVNAKIYLLHVYQPVLPATDIPVLEMVPDEEMENEFNDKMQKVARTLKDKNGWDVTVSVLSSAGLITEEINKVIQEKKIDLVIMGMRGKSTNLDEIFGSTATDMIKRSNCPLLLIPEGILFAIPDKVAIAFDFKHPDDIRRISVAKEFVKRFNAKFLAFSIIGEKDDDPSAKAVVYASVEKILHDYDHSIHFNLHDDVTEGILNFMDEHMANMLVLFHHSHNVFARIFTSVVSKEISFDIKTPLLVINEKANIYPPVDL